jgi:hypothetical protein
MVMLLVLLVSIAAFRKRMKRLHAVFFTLWFLPFLIGYIYSVTRNPVLQDSTMLFGFPFLLMLIFGWLPSIRERKEMAYVSAILALGLIYYVGSYKPYSLTDHFGRLRELVQQTTDWQQAHKNYRTAVFYNVDAPYFIDYYYDKAGRKRENVLGDINNGNSELLSFRKAVDASDADYFIYCWSTKEHPLEIPEIIREKFPYLLQKSEWFNSAWYVFGRSAGMGYIHVDDDVLFSQPSDFSVKNETTSGWSQPCRIFQGETDSALRPLPNSIYTNTAYTVLDSSCNYGPLLHMKLGDLLRHPDNYLALNADIRLSKDAEAILVIEIHRADSLLYWNGRSSKTQLSASDTSDYHHVYFGWPLQEDLKLDDEVRFYIYSANGKAVRVRSITALAQRGHIGVYGERPDFK